MWDNEEKFETNTDPLVFDTDGDGCSDGWELDVFFTDPLDPASVFPPCGG